MAELATSGPPSQQFARGLYPADPPELQALLRLQPDDECRNMVRAWYYNVVQGDASSPVVHLGGLINILVYSSQLKTKQLEDISASIAALNKRLSQAGIKPASPWWEKWLKRIGAAALVALIFFLAGRYEDASHQAVETGQANIRLVDAIKRLPSASNVTTFLRSKGGDLTIDRIQLADGTDGAGIIITPGTLKLGPPAMSQTGEKALIPIQ